PRPPHVAPKGRGGSTAVKNVQSHALVHIRTASLTEHRLLPCIPGTRDGRCDHEFPISAVLVLACHVFRSYLYHPIRASQDRNREGPSSFGEATCERLTAFVVLLTLLSLDHSGAHRRLIQGDCHHEVSGPVRPYDYRPLKQTLRQMTNRVVLLSINEGKEKERATSDGLGEDKNRVAYIIRGRRRCAHQKTTQQFETKDITIISG
ncbi:hypothetical protein LY78DRAFT_724569, partial [Colletotrichum sublineola]